MQDDLEKQAEAIFTAIMALPATERAAMALQACADNAALLARVQALLHAAAEADAFLASPTVTAADEPPTLDFEKQIGRYRILERIGGGGMGEVYVAEQTEPIKRRVAVKLIKTGMDTRQVVARFEAERQALAMMDHPNIARVFDAGATDAGRPYFVMELVRGVPITRFCDDNKFTTRQRVELLVPVCQAVQHAHQKGIIHRDIKPHNVLVTLHDGKPVPKVIDFGIAKATSQPLTDKTVYTEFRAMIGTPAYMSPEQAEMSGLDIDTRSDIYSLGVLAYELFTGTTPFESSRLIKAGLMEIQRIIKEEEPPRPSQRISTLGETLTSIASHRSVEANKLGRSVAGELDWIVMRALEKDRKRRYDTASDLAAELTRHLAGEAVVAAPPSWAYRSRKFVKKHRGAVAGTSAVTIALMLGIVGTTAMSVKARHQENRAKELANREADRANREAKAKNSAEMQAYIASLTLGQSAMSNGNFPEARLFLDSCPANKRNWEWKFLRKQAGLILKSFPNSDSFVQSGDGKRILIRSTENGTVRLIDTENAVPAGKVIRLNNLSSASVTALSFDGRTMLEDTSGFHIWDTALAVGSAQVISSFSECKLSPNGRLVATLSEDLVTFKVWDAISGQPIWTCTVAGGDPTNGMVRFEFSPNSSLLGMTVSLHNLEHSELSILHLPDCAQLAAHIPIKDRIESLRFSPDSREIVVDSGKTAQVWDCTNAMAVSKPIRHTGSSVFGLQPWFTDDCKDLMVPTDYGLSAYDARTGTALNYSFETEGKILQAGRATGNGAFVSIDGSFVDSVRLHAAETVTWASRPEFPHLIKYFQLDSDGAIIGQVSAFQSTPGESTCPKQASASADVFLQGEAGKFILMSADNFDSAIDTIPAESVTQRLSEVTASRANVSAPSNITRSPNFSIALSKVGQLEVHSSCGECIFRLGLNGGSIVAFEVSPDRSRLITADETTIRFYDCATWQQVAAFNQTFAISSLAFTADGTRLILRFTDGVAQIWDPRPIEDRRRLWAKRVPFAFNGVWQVYNGHTVTVTGGIVTDDITHVQSQFKIEGDLIKVMWYEGGEMKLTINPTDPDTLTAQAARRVDDPAANASLALFSAAMTRTAAPGRSHPDIHAHRANVQRSERQYAAASAEPIDPQ